MTNPLTQLHRFGQSVWLDSISRDLLTSGRLKRLIDEDDLRGVTSNPTIFQQAISASRAYDEAIQRLAGEGRSSSEIVDALMIDDIQRAADLFRPLYERTQGADGFVSIEVSPQLAHDTQRTIAEASRLARLVGRANVMVKIPGTREGLPAIARMIAEGCNINVTLLFAIERYEEVIEAYLAGLEQRAREGRPIHRIASVASFFVSRVDTSVDKLLHAKLASLTSSSKEREALEALLGQAAIANAKLAYQRFQARFQSERFEALKTKGAKVQRVLWASTSTKDPTYRDVRYVEELIGPHTVNTLPSSTLEKFREHGRVGATLERDAPKAQEIIRRLAQVGIELARVTQELEDAGVKAFADSFQSLLESVETKRRSLAGAAKTPRAAFLGHNGAHLEETLQRLDQERFVQRLVQRDVSLWKSDPVHQRLIQNRLGWLTVPDRMREETKALAAFAEEVRREGFTHALLLGMGGSSLFPEVCRTTFGVRPGFLDVTVLDSTVPATILMQQRAQDIAKTLLIVSTKSGTTIETLSLFRYFAEQIRAVTRKPLGAHCIAITDPGTPLERLARAQAFRRIFLNPPEVGGRFSALSYFGLVPAALLGVDLGALLERVQRLMRACEADLSAKDNPGVWLGTLLIELMRAGRDKVTFVFSPPLADLGVWIEQLLAESISKEGRGLVPIEGEPLGKPAIYAEDRLFMSIRLAGSPDESSERALQALEAAGHPVIRWRLEDALDLGAECFRWEWATAVAGALLGINPFDEPNVQESKDNTKTLLEIFAKDGQLPQEVPVLSEGSVTCFGDARMAGSGSLADALASVLSTARPGDYVGLTAYLPRTPAHHQLLQLIRLYIRDARRLATTLGYGPRFLHSTGQLHKGGPNTGIFIQLTADDPQDAPIPDAPYTFGVLKQAQALGDWRALQDKGRRVIRIHLGRDVQAGLRQVLRAVETVLATGAKS